MLQSHIYNFSISINFYSKQQSLFSLKTAVQKIQKQAHKFMTAIRMTALFTIQIKQ